MIIAVHRKYVNVPFTVTIKEILDAKRFGDIFVVPKTQMAYILYRLDATENQMTRIKKEYPHVNFVDRVPRGAIRG